MLRVNVEFLAQVRLVDYLFYSGFVFWLIGGMALLGGSRLTREDSISVDDIENYRENFRFFILMLLSGLPIIVSSAVLYRMGVIT
ncbi:hypothetical protein [Photobacterium sp. TLY01]|uniref:hypothetical protein n=1 Tax=Photobacterium sp. TLY01 TaxID=2907534 RepID=UPI001F1C0EB4|nr:hypothetical protein [Photobacterium sp. TLY01]UIP28080.1 hypothetical protein LN341_00680 [Photobacterium sp. TLY01]